MRPVVALDIIATGPDPFRDSIADVGATVWTHDQIAHCFGELIRPRHEPDSAFHARYPDLSPGMLAQARDPDKVLDELLEFFPEDAIFVSHHASTVKPFLQAATRDRFLRPVLDTSELAKICFPNLPSYTLDDLLQALDIIPAPGHFSLAHCDDTLRLWQRIQAETHTWSAPLLDEINRLLDDVPAHPLCDFFRNIASAPTNQANLSEPQHMENPQRYADLFACGEKAPAPRRNVPDPEEWEPLDEDDVVAHLEQGGEFARQLRGYEFRRQQIDMARSVVRAFNTSTHLMVEAGTGIGKSLAYLLPSVQWAATNHVPVVISTNTKNLQSQLFKKDLPVISNTLGIDFSAAIIKGRRNYLCVRKLLYLLNHAAIEMTPEERFHMLRVVVWAAHTTTGDMSDSSAVEEPGAPRLHDRLSSAIEECLGPACGHRGHCFLYRARAKSLAADVVVANHSVVFAEMDNAEASAVLPPYAHMVFDEAHNIEDAATNWLSVELSHVRIRFILGRLLRTGRRNKASGLLPTLLHELEHDDDHPRKELLERLTTMAEGVRSALDAAGPLLLSFFQSLLDVYLSGKDHSSARIQRGPARPTAEPPDAAATPGVDLGREPLDPVLEEARKEMLAALARVMRSTEALTDQLRSEAAADLSCRADFAQDISAATLAIKEFCEHAAFVLDASAEGYVFWVEPAPRHPGEARAFAAPIQIGRMLADQLYDQRNSIIFCSATLTVRGSCDFLKHRLGLDRLPEERLTELNVGTPFDYRRQCAVMVPMFLPEPNAHADGYAAALGDLLTEVFRRTRGRGMVLFTSYSMLRHTTEVVKGALEREGTLVLAQGESGSRENITELFRRDIGSVLMGTHSFWEGVDVVGETLSCLVMARLPFAVYTDPIIQARCEQVEAEGGNSFIDYSVPSAVIKFRQGFGRLIRHRTDRGIVIVTDRRILSKRYGDWFRRSIPARTLSFSSRDPFLTAIEQFMEPPTP